MKTKQTIPILIPDNKVDALLIEEKTNDLPWLSVDTSAEEMYFGNDTDDPDYIFQGSGSVTIEGLTEGQVVVPGAGSVLTGYAGLFFDGTNLGVGTNVPVGLLDATKEEASGSAVGLNLENNWTANNNMIIRFRKSRGNSKASPSTVVTGDYIGSQDYYAHDGTSYNLGATISIITEGTITTGQTPTKIVFSTENLAGTFAERLTIQDGNIGINEPAPDSTLEVGGTFHGTSTGHFEGNLSVDADIIQTDSASGKPIHTLENTNADAAGPETNYYKNSTAAINNILGVVRAYGNNSGATKTEFSSIQTKAVAVTAGAETSEIKFTVKGAGTDRNAVLLGGSGEVRLGLNTLTPSHTLDVAGNAQITGAAQLDSTLYVTGTVRTASSVSHTKRDDSGDGGGGTPKAITTSGKFMVEVTPTATTTNDAYEVDDGTYQGQMLVIRNTSGSITALVDNINESGSSYLTVPPLEQKLCFWDDTDEEWMPV